MARKKKIPETVVIGTLDPYDFDGAIEDVIKRLEYYRVEGANLGLTNIRVSTDSHEEAIYEYGGYQGKYETKWTTKITGEKDV